MRLAGRNKHPLRLAAFLAGAMIAILSGVSARAQNLPGFPEEIPKRQLTQAEQQICTDLDMCVDILLRHDSESFDYYALAQDFQRLGAPALQGLLQIMRSDSGKGTKHAQSLMGHSKFVFPPTAQIEIANFWPSANPITHKILMQKIGSPLMRNRAISTLNHPDPDIRQHSRDILNWISKGYGKTKAETFTAEPVPPAAFADLVKAAVDNATPEIMTLIGTFPQGLSRSVLTRFLLSENGDIPTAAYAQLYKQNPDMALAAFKATLPNLKTPRQALALSQLLQRRNLERSQAIKDGFYVHLAHSLVADKTLPPLAHVMAMDAILNSAPLADKTLPNTPQVQGVFNNLVTKSDASFLGYHRDFAKKSGENTAQFLPVIWAEVLRRNRAPKSGAFYEVQNGDYYKFEDHTYSFMRSVSELARTPKYRNAVLPILRQGLGINKDWRTQRAAIYGLANARDKISEIALRGLAENHPILDVRAAAHDALNALETGVLKPVETLNALGRAAQYCSIDRFDFAEDAKQLPFFEENKLRNARGQLTGLALRHYLKTAVPAKRSPNTSGWLAGYNANPSAGGLYYYDNVSGKPEFMSGETTIAVLPVWPTPLGTLASEFWVVEKGRYSNDDSGHISYLRFENGKHILRRHLRLPAAPTRMNVLADQSLHMDFTNSKVSTDLTQSSVVFRSGDKAAGYLGHPPLRLLPNGKLVSGCAQPQLKPKSGAPRTLPY